MLTKILLTGLMLLVLAAAFVRLAPTEPEEWHVAPTQAAVGDYPSRTGFETLRQITTGPEVVLALLDQVIMATPRTRRIAGDVTTGRITYQTRSALWGFPDYTTVAIVAPDGADANAAAPLLSLQGRLRFGADDLGVNRARMTDWLTQLGPLVVEP